MSDQALPATTAPADSAPLRGVAAVLLQPSLTRQCWGFMLGSSMFALGSAPGFASWAGSGASNVLYFIGAWGFTYAGFVQWFLSGDRTTVFRGHAVVRADWLSAATQSVGTILFNVSTSAALQAHAVAAQQRFVWSPDAAGSLAFLVSGALAMRAYRHANTWWDPRKAGWWSTQINMIGCIAFGASAVGAFITQTGGTLDASIANVGTFIGAICFFLASLVVLPFWTRTSKRAD